MLRAALILAAALLATACATRPPPATVAAATTATMAATAKVPDPDLQAAQQADQSSPAVGALAVPVGRWLGVVILQMFQNVRLNVDVKLDATPAAASKPPKASP